MKKAPTTTESLPPIAYHAPTMEDLVRSCELAYKQEFYATGNRRALMLHTACRQYYNCFTNKDLHKRIKTEAEELSKMLQEQFPLLEHIFKGRLKAFISYINKYIHFLDINRALNDLKDIFACRIVIKSAHLDPVECANACYEVMTAVIDFYLLRGYQLCHTDRPSDVLPDDDPLRKILTFPTNTEIPTEYRPFVKNYGEFPKRNTGYQSLHVLLFDPVSTITLEIQIRTDEWDRIAEEGYKTPVDTSSQLAAQNQHFVGWQNFGSSADIMEGLPEGLVSVESAQEAMSCFDLERYHVRHSDYKEHAYPNPIVYDSSKLAILHPGNNAGNDIVDAEGFEKPTILFVLHYAPI